MKQKLCLCSEFLERLVLVVWKKKNYRPATINTSIQVHLLQCSTAQAKTYLCRFRSMIINNFIIYETKYDLI